jgi:DHA2 family multidrug resistance protein
VSPVAATPNGARRIFITVCTMAAVIMQALDQTIANVALPYMQGSLSASIDQVNWVLTSYVVAAAIATAPVAWLANRFGRKKLYLACITGFTVASFLCGLAQTIEQIVVFRLLQGACGAALVPLSQATLLDNYTLQERAQIMSIWGGVIMLGPILGPIVGGSLTEAYSWHWVFLINVPIGIAAVTGLSFLMDETAPRTEMTFDWFGFMSLAVAIGGLQLMLDRGEQLGWLSATEIQIELAASIIGFYFFFAHSFTAKNPFIRFEIFTDRNFLGGCLFMAVLGIALLGTMALVSPFLQNVLGLPALNAGYLLASRGGGTLIGMLIIGRLMRFVEARWLLFSGLLAMALSMYLMSGFTDMTSPWTIVWVSMIQGFGIGLVFVPRSTMAFATLAPHLRTEGTSMMTLFRNVGGALGISIVIANLTNGMRTNYADLAERVTPFNQALWWPDVSSIYDMATDTGRALMDVLLQQQAAIIAYANDFKMMMIILLCTLPLSLVVDSSRQIMRPRPNAPANEPVAEPAE